ncbi:hypothetical protein Tco_0081134, partial [Tanacetum coccineum]
MNMGQDRQMQMVIGNGGNQFRQYAGQNVGNQNGCNVAQNVKNQVVQNAVQNPGVQNVGNPNGLIVVLGNADSNENQNKNGNVVAARAEGSSRSRVPNIQKQDDSLWFRVIQAVHGDKIDSHSVRKVS